jgi:hypothetical protein
MKVLLDEGVEPFLCMPKQVERLSGHPTERKNEANRPRRLAVPDKPALSTASDIAQDDPSPQR